MTNVMIIDGHKAVISYDPDIEMFRGEFIGLNGGADFYAADIKGLRREGKMSLKIYLDECALNGIDPHRKFSGKFLLRTSQRAHQAAVLAATAEGVSLNEWVSSVVEQAVAAH